MCQVGLSCQLSLNQPGWVQKVLQPSSSSRGDGGCCTSSANVRQASKQTSKPDYWNDCPVYNQECRVRQRQISSINPAIGFYFWSHGLKRTERNLIMRHCWVISIYYLFMFSGDGCRKVERQHITSSCSWCHKSLLQSCLFWNAGEYAHNECIESCLLSRSFSTRTICTVSCFDPPALCTSSISWLFLFCFVLLNLPLKLNLTLS